MKQIQKAGTVWEDVQGRKYTNVIVLPHLAKVNNNGSLILQAAFYFDEEALDNPPFMFFTKIFGKEPVIENFVPLKDETGSILFDKEGKPLMDEDKTTFEHYGGPRITQELILNFPIDNPLAFQPKNRASQLAWNELEFSPGLKFGDYFDFENGLLPE